MMVDEHVLYVVQKVEWLHLYPMHFQHNEIEKMYELYSEKIKDEENKTAFEYTFEKM
jgi:hypothetical protein